MTSDKAKAIAILAATAAAVFVAWKLYEAASYAKDKITKDFNPLSDENVAYEQFKTRDSKGVVTATLGTEIYDALHHSDGRFKWPWEDDEGLKAPEKDQPVFFDWFRPN